MADFNGTSGDDIFTGGIDNDTAAGNGGNDMLSGGGGHDKLGGGAGSDVVNGDDGSDQLYSSDISPPFTRPYYGNPWTPPVLDVGIEFDLLSGGAGSDLLFAGYGDSVDGGADSDVLYISFMGATSGVTVDFRQLNNNGSITIGGGTLTSIEAIGWIQGSNFDDVIRDSDASADFAPIFGMGGNDRLYGGYYTGDIHGGDGDDIIDRGSSPYGFQHFGEAGNDLLIGSYNGETLDGGGDNDELRGDSGFDNLYGGDGNDLMDGGSYDDVMMGGAGNDMMYGAGDPDRMDGGAGDDTIYGDFSLIYGGNGLSPSRNEDRLFGGAGADIVRGDQGDDQLWSGESVDGFAFEGKDDAELQRDQLFGGDGNDSLAIGYGDDADGGTGSDTLRISLAGAAAGVAFSTAGFTPGGSWSVNGGTIQNVETLTIITGSAFADTITIATHGFGVNLDGGDGDDVITSFNSSIVAMGGNGNDRFINGNAGDSIDGGAGIDTADYRNAVTGVTVTLAATAGQTGSGPGGDQLKNIENIDGSALGDTLTGSNDANFIQGMAGNDTINGSGGADILIGGEGADLLNGGAGNDIFRVEEAGDTVVEGAGGGFDAVYAVVSYALAAGSEVELLSAIDPGSAAAMDLTGNEFANMLIGTAGSNTLIGGAGNDTLFGGAGNDFYRVETAGDIVVEYAGGGFDSVYAVDSHALTAGSEIELLSAIDPASAAAMNLTGNEFANLIYGNAGVNTLIGGGGADTLIGGGGNDFYRVEEAGDTVVEGAGGGFDSVYAVGSYTLAAGSEVELLSAIDPASSAAINLTGNEYANRLYGNAAGNVLIGGGGADILFGGGGNDIYRVEEAGDIVVEAAGGGFDSVYAVVSYALVAGSEIELLSAIDPGSASAMDLTGNEYANRLYGTAGANVLIGGGGADMLFGGAGNDIYRVEEAGDVVVEAAGGGSDWVYAVTSYTLAAGSEVELLSAIDPGSAGAMDLTGNEYANRLYGTAGINVLDGKGGNDLLTGGAGADFFAFTTALDAGNVDTIADFVAGTDKIRLDDAVFSAVGGLGALNPNAFVTGANAADIDDRIVYNSATGQLFYDADGSGGGAAIQFATLSPGLSLTASDFQVI